MRGSPALAFIISAAVIGCGRAQPAAESLDSVLAPGDSLYARSEFDSARTIWQEALSKPGVAGTPTEARLLLWLGLAAYRLAEYPEARRLGEQALTLARRFDAPGDVAQAQNALALLAWQEGRLIDAADLAGDALAGFQALRDAGGVAKASNQLGLAHYELGRFPEAREAFIATRIAGRTLANPRYEGRALTNLAMWEIWAGDPARALDLIGDARRLADSAGDAVGLAAALGQEAVAHSVMGQPGLALVAVDSALAVARRHGMRDEEAGDLLVVAGIYAEAGDPDQAFRAYAAARQINRELGLTLEAGTVLRDEAALRARRGSLDLARANALEALALHREAGARHEEFLDLLGLADVERRARQFAAAGGRLDDARRLSEELGSVQARLSLALAEARLADEAGDPAGCLRALARAAPDLKWGGASAEAEWGALGMRAWAAQHQLDSAAVAGRFAIQAIERVRAGFASSPMRTSYAAERSQVYADLVLVLLRQGRADDAFAVADAARGRALLEHLGTARTGASGPVTDLAEAERLLRQIDHLLARLAREDAVPRRERSAARSATSEELWRNLERARSEYQAHLVRAAEREPGRARLLGARPAARAEIQAALRADEILVEYLVTEEHLFIFVLTRDTVRVVTRAISQEQLTHQVQLARDLLVSLEAHDREVPVTEALHDMLLGPVREDSAFGRARHLIVVPHGILTYLPFAVLRNRARGTILAEELALSYLPAAAALPLLRARPALDPARVKAAGFAPFPDLLPSTVDEVRALERVRPGTEVRVGSQASEAAVREALSRGALVHIATHGILSARAPLFSRIELARKRETASDDGRLEVHELLNLTITSPLVFLSGCQTGLGNAWATAFDQGEDFATLAQAFLYAGAGAVVATLWRIDDAGAAAFAARFFQHLQTQPAADALAMAQRDLRLDPRWRSPYYWAGYTLSGVFAEVPAKNPRAVAVQTTTVRRP